MNLSLHQLRVLLAVADSRSFTGAAARLHLTQSAVSRAVGQAERSLGAPVFTRTTRSLAITERGRTILPVARTIVGDFDRGTALLADAAQGEPKLLTIAALPSVTASILPGALATFRTRNPQTRISISTGDATRIAGLVRDKAVDVAVTVDDGRELGTVFIPVLQDDFVCLYPRAHPVGRSARLSWKRVAEEPLIALATSSSVRRRADEGFEAADARPGSVTEVDDMATAAALVAAGLGVTVATRLLLPLTAFADLSSTKLVEPTLSRRVGAVVVRHDADILAGSLIEALQAEAHLNPRT